MMASYSRKKIRRRKTKSSAGNGSGNVQVRDKYFSPLRFYLKYPNDFAIEPIDYAEPESKSKAQQHNSYWGL